MPEVAVGAGSVVKVDDTFYYILLVQGFYLTVGVKIKCIVAKDALG